MRAKKYKSGNRKFRSRKGEASEGGQGRTDWRRDKFGTTRKAEASSIPFESLKSFEEA